MPIFPYLFTIKNKYLVVGITFPATAMLSSSVVVSVGKFKFGICRNLTIFSRNY